MTQKEIDEIIDITRIVRGVGVGENLVVDGKCIFEWKERIYVIQKEDGDRIAFAKYTGLEVNPPQMIYDFSATYNKTAFEIMIKHFNKLYP